MKNVALLFALVAISTSAALGNDFVWDAGGANSSWVTNANWDPESPAPNYATTSTDTFLIGEGFAAATTDTTFGAALTVQGTLNVATQGATASKLSLNGGTLAASNAGGYSLINGTLTVDPGAAGALVGVLNNSTASDFYLRMKLNKDLINGTGDLVKTGSGRLRLGGVAGGTWDGTLTIESGSVYMENVNGLAQGTIQLNAGGGTFEIGSGFASGSVYINNGATMAWNSQNVQAYALHLNGGTLSGTGATPYCTTNSNFYIDADSIIEQNGTDRFYIQAKLIGSANIEIGGTGVTTFAYNGNVNTYSGTINVGDGKIVSMENTWGLCGGTADVASGGTFRIGAGFSNGQVNIGEGAIADNANYGGGNTNDTVVSNLHLQGGTLQGAGNQNMGHGGSNSKVWVDSDSVLKGKTAGQSMIVSAQLNGEGDLEIQGPGSVYLNSDQAASTYSGTITVASDATLRMNNRYGLGGGTVQLGASSGSFLLGAGLSNGTVNVGAGAIAQVDGGGAFVTGELHLRGGTLAFTGSGYIENTSGSRIYVDEGFTSYVSDAAGGQAGLVRASLVGAGDLLITGAGDVALGSNTLTTGYTGTIRIASGTTLRMENANGLSGGTIELDGASGTFKLSEGFANGSVNVKTGGSVYADMNGAWKIASQLRLQGGTVSSLSTTNNNYYVGDNTDNSRLYLDSESAIQASYATKYLHMGAKLYGTATANKTGTGILRMYRNSTSSYTGNWNIQEGILELANISSWNAQEALGSGAAVNIAGGAYLRFTDNNSNNIWSITKTLTGTGTVQSSGTSDKFVISRDATDSFGGISPGTNGIGTLTFNWTAVNTSTQLDFAKSATNARAAWNIEVLDSSTYDKIVSNGYLSTTALTNSVLVVDTQAPVSGTLTIYQGIASQNLSAMSFGEVQWLNNYLGTVVYGTDGSIKLTNIITPVLWETASGDWTGAANWSPDGKPTGTTLTSVLNGGVCEISTAESTATLYIKNADSTVNIAATGGLAVGTSVDVLAGSALSVSGALATPILRTAGTTSFNSGATGTVADLRVSGGTTAVNAGWAGAITNLTVSGGGAFSVADGQDFTTTSTTLSSGTLDLGIGTSSSLGTLSIYGGMFTADRAMAAGAVTMSGGAWTANGAVGVTSITATGGTMDFNQGLTASGAVSATNASIAIDNGAALQNVTAAKTTADAAVALTMENGTYTAGTVQAAGTVVIDNATVAVTALNVGVNNSYQTIATITDSTVTAGSTNIRYSNSSGNPTTLTVGDGGTLILAATANYGFDSGNYNQGRYVLAEGGVIRFTSSIDLTTFQARTQWNSGVLEVVGTLGSYNNAALTAGQIIDFGATGGLAAGTDKMYLRGGEMRFSNGFARDARLQMTEDLGTIIVSGGALSGMGGMVSANLVLSGAAATWSTGTATMSSGSVLMLADGAKATVGAGKFFTADQIAFAGTGGTVELADGFLIHGAQKLVLSAAAAITGSGQILVGSSGIDLGATGDEGSLIGAGAGLVVYGDISGNGSLVNTTVYGNISVGHSPGEMTLDGATLSGSSVLTMEIGGAESGLYDQVILPGSLNLQSGATLEIAWYNGFEAVAGQSFQLFDINGGAINGTFALVTPGFSNPDLTWDLSHLYTSGTITVTGIPEPATMALLAVGGLLILARRRGRREHE
ncbi:MAG: PEP-CTERM sorting domain-containing protein [Planctomycetaceae bacterium]|nr:PEP-CTERM sorting domain-containing protein [Planctomycetaceae bacterium]